MSLIIGGALVRSLAPLTFALDRFRRLWPRADVFFVLDNFKKLSALSLIYPRIFIVGEACKVAIWFVGNELHD